MDISLEKWGPRLVPSLAESANDARIGLFLNDGFPFPYTQESAKKFIDAVLNSPQDVHRAIVADGRAVGCVSLCRGRGVLSRTFELGYWLTPSLWNRGIATQAVGQLCAAAFSETDAERIQAQVFSTNPSSARVLEKCGFVREAVLRRAVCKAENFCDLVVYARVRDREGEEK